MLTRIALDADQTVRADFATTTRMRRPHPRRMIRDLRVSVEARAHARARSAPTGVALRHALDSDVSTDDLLARLRTQSSGPFFVAPGSAREVAAWLDTAVAGWGRRTIANADRIAAGRVRLLGQNEIDVRDASEHGGYRWHEDFSSGYRWQPHTFHKKVAVPYGSADIKIPWELSRCQHLPTLGMAYALTGDDAYAAAAASYLADWIDRNPPGYGVNWFNAMEAAIRAVNWLWTVHLIADSNRVGDEFLVSVLACLDAHAAYITRNIERYPRGVTTNHTLADYVGLLYIALALPELAGALAWERAAVVGVEECMRLQVHPDGGDYENSVPYHRLVLEMFFGAELLLSRNGRTLSDAYRSRLERMFEYVHHYTRPDGLAPLVGDSDDGRLQILSSYFDWEPQDHRYLLGPGSIVFGRSDFLATPGTTDASIEEAAWLLGQDAASSLLGAEAPDRRASRAFPVTGTYVMRNDATYAFISADPVGTAGMGNHKHNDLLSFELVVDGTLLVADRGSYAYSSDRGQRDAFRATAAHSTVQIDGEEQNRFSDWFGMHRDAEVTIDEWSTGSMRDLLVASHTGYRRLAARATHTRKLVCWWDPFAFVVVDSIAARSAVRVESFVQLAEGVTVVPGAVSSDVTNRGAAALNGVIPSPFEVGEGARLRSGGVEIALLPFNSTPIEIEKGWSSPRYGLRERAPVVLLHPADPHLDFGYVLVRA